MQVFVGIECDIYSRQKGTSFIPFGNSITNIHGLLSTYNAANRISKASSYHSHVPNTTGTDAPPKEGELRCYECGQKGHINSQCPRLKHKELPGCNLKWLMRTTKWMSS